MFKVGNITRSYYEEESVFTRKSSTPITDEDWEEATRALLSIEKEIEVGKKLIQDFFRSVTASSVDFYP